MKSIAREIFGKFLNKEKYKVFLLEDNALFLHSLKSQLVKSFEEDVIIKTFTNSVDLKAQMSDCPSLVVMDYYLDERSDLEGVDLIKRLKD